PRRGPARPAAPRGVLLTAPRASPPVATGRLGVIFSHAARRPRVSRPALLVAAYCGALLCLGLTAGDLYRTEGLRARVADAMLRGGDWVVPRLYGEPLLTKPPGAYAAVATVSAPFGAVRDWTARVPSVLAAAAAVLLFCWTFSRVLGKGAGLL